jgi:hypothetical protein
VQFPSFAVACGEEASDPVVWHDGGPVRVDELQLSGHVDRLDEDLADVASLGVEVWRYGMPWRLTEPEPGRYDWALWDRALDACKRARLQPVVDLCHFGLPDHYRGFCDPAWVEGFVRYVEAFIERYPEPRWFTPVNEPGITALMSALFGVWNDRRTSLDDYYRAIGHVTLANLEALARLRADRDAWWIGAEGFGCELFDPDDAEAAEAAERSRAVQQVVWDLHFGVPARPEAAAVYDVVPDRVLDRVAALAAELPPDRMIAGHDLYPVSVNAHGTRAARPLSIVERVAAYESEATAWYERYRVPFWVAETSNLGLPVEQGTEWLNALMQGLDRLHDASLPVRGICWYSRGDQFDWQTALTQPVGAVTEVGLFDVERRRRPVADAFARLAAERRVSV